MSEQEIYNLLNEDKVRYESYLKSGSYNLRDKAQAYRLAYREIFRRDPDMSCRDCVRQMFERLHKWRINYEK